MLASSWRRRSTGFISAKRMPYAGMANVSDRADLLAYLLKATK
jgi:cytochrome c2